MKLEVYVVLELTIHFKMTQAISCINKRVISSGRIERYSQN